MANAKLKCTQCRSYQLRETMTSVNSGNYCNDKCLLAYALDSRRQKQAKAKIKKSHTKRKKDFNINDVGKQLALTQPVFNKLRRMQEFEWFRVRGIEPECISCGKKNMDWCNGHFKTVGSQGALRFDPMNSYLQCNRYCNKGLSGNIEGNKNTRGYKKGLIERFGIEKANEIFDYCEAGRVKKWVGQELFEMRKLFNKQIRLLEDSCNED